MGSAVQEAPPDAADPARSASAEPTPLTAHREWWQHLAERRSRWLTMHPRLARVVVVARTVLLAGSLVWLAGLWLFMPELRLGMRAYLGCLWVVIAWFALARTKTLTWSGYLRFFTACVLWSVGIGVFAAPIATQVAQLDAVAATGTGAQIAIAGIVEEVGKLAPVVLLVLLAPRRAARFASVDWLLLGLAAGTAFLAVEEVVRRTALTTGSIGFASALGPSPDVALPPEYVRFGLVPVPTAVSADAALLAPTSAAQFGGHAIMTALVTALAGLAIAAWQARRRLTGTTVGVLAVLALWSVVADHAMYNAGQSLFSALPGDDGTPAWLDPDTTTIPWWLRVPWSFLGHGHGRLGVFLLLVAVCLLVDAARLASRPAANLTGQAAPRWVTPSVAAAPGLVRGVPGAALGLGWVVVRDVAQTVAGFTRHPPEEPGRPAEPRRAAAARGAALVSGQRALRELAYEHASARPHPWVRRLAAVAVLAGLGWLAFAAAPATAREIGDSTSTVFDMPGSGPGDLPSGLPTDLPSMPSMPPLPSGFPSFDPDDFPTLGPDFEFPGSDPGAGSWLAGLLDTIADWWHDQPLIAQLAIGAGIAAVVVLSGGSLGLALGVSGVLTWGLDKSAGIATFTRDPQQATRDYFATATPAQLAADTLGVALTFAPGNFATAKVVRSTADSIMGNPAVWLNRRRDSLAQVRQMEETGTVRAASAGVSIDSAKWDYLFGRVTGTHNGARSGQNVSQFSQIGLVDNAEGRALIRQHLEDVVRDGTNIVKRYNNKYGTFEIRESLFAGPNGFLKLESAWQVTDDGYRLTTIIPMGENTRYRLP